MLKISTRELDFDYKPHKKELSHILQEIQKLIQEKNVKFLDHDTLRKILVKYPSGKKNLFRRSHLIQAYRSLVDEKLLPQNEKIISAIQMKPMRTQSGVAPVTVLTKPFPCPGQCIFCPNDVRMPKSYLANEPGAQRAERNKFDPYLQTYNRLLAFQAIGHNVEKVELLILGGTWSFYPEFYQIWFIKRCFDAMNDFPHRDKRKEAEKIAKNIFAEYQENKKNKKIDNSKTYNERVSEIAGGNIQGFFEAHERASWEELEKAQKVNEAAYSRNVGLVLETRPDCITETEVIKIRRFGATKVQIGIQSLRDSIMKKNKRGHGQKDSQKAIRLLRLAGFKIHGHWMPNLSGATPKSDIADYKKLWTPEYSPDELKIYPTSIIAGTELYILWKQKKYRPYTYDELLKVLVNTIPQTPRYARLSRIIRDFPSTDIVEGNKLTNFRQIAEKEIAASGKKLQDIRSREIKNTEIQEKDLKSEIIKYKTSDSTEYFLSYKTKNTDKIAAFLRLSIPKKSASMNNFIHELRGCAMIREVHVYGHVVGLGKKDFGKAQHLGLGTRLTELACNIAKKNGFKKLAVISAIGTRDYYRKRKFHDTGLYLIRNLNEI